MFSVPAKSTSFQAMVSPLSSKLIVKTAWDLEEFGFILVSLLLLCFSPLEISLLIFSIESKSLRVEGTSNLSVFSFTLT